MSSIVFLVLALFISLVLSGLPFLVSYSKSSLPNINSQMEGFQESVQGEMNITDRPIPTTPVPTTPIPTTPVPTMPPIPAIFLPEKLYTNISVNSPDNTPILNGEWVTIYSTAPYKFGKTLPSFNQLKYYVSSSSICDDNIVNYSPIRIFDASYALTNGWITARNVYNRAFATTQSGEYTGKISTTYDKTLSVSGEWVQLQLPYPLNLTSFNILPHSYFPNALPKHFYVLGSNDGRDWSKVFSVTGQTYSDGITKTTTGEYTNSSYLTTFTVPPAKKTYTYFRLVISSNLNTISGNGINVMDFAALKQWNLFGDVYDQPLL